MQFVVIFLILGILFCVLTGNPGLVLYIGAGVLLLISAALVLLFLYCVILLLRTERHEAVFIRIDHPTPESSHKVAFYRIGDVEYPCLFPEEGILRAKLYRTDRTYRVRLLRKRECVFDRYAVITTVFGLIAGLTIGTITLLIHFI